MNLSIAIFAAENRQSPPSSAATGLGHRVRSPNSPGNDQHLTGHVSRQSTAQESRFENPWAVTQRTVQLQRRLPRLYINPKLSAKNIYTGYKSAADLLAYSTAHCAGLTDAKGRALRKDAVRMCVTILKPPAAYMATLAEQEQKRFLQDGVNKLTEIIRKENIRSVAWHFDESGPHVHVFWEPMTKDGRLCAKEMHSLAFLGRLNREMPAYLREHGWDIDDCNAYDAAAETLKTEKEKAEHSIQEMGNFL